MSNYNTTLQSNNTDLQAILDSINTLPDAGGVELPELTNEGTASDLLSGKELIDGDGNKVTGTFSIDNELDTQDDLIAQIQSVVDSLPEAGGGEPTLQTKTVTPTTSQQTVTPDSGYDGLSEVTVKAIPSTYVKPSTTKTATTYTPSTTNQIIAAGTYCSGVQTIQGDANLIPANIVSGKSIFGVAGTAEVGSGGSGGIETYTGTIVANSKYSEAYILYTDKNLTLQETNLGILANSITVEVPKNTAIIIDAPGGASADSGCEDLMGFGCSYHITANNFIITVY